MAVRISNNFMKNDIFSRDPVNRVAVWVTRFKGEEYSPEKSDLTKRTYDVMPLTIGIPKDVKNYTGLIFGKVKVVGYFGRGRKISKNWSHVWLVRCVCGMFELRNSETLRRALAQNRKDIGCQFCAQQEHQRFNRKKKLGE